MIDISEIFLGIQENGCPDIASSLASQGVDLNEDISIPIFEGVYLKIMNGSKAGFLCNSIAEFQTLRSLSKSIGCVAFTINIAEMDLLSLFGLLATYTPQTGGIVFYKNNIPEIQALTEDMVMGLITATGLPIPEDVARMMVGSACGPGVMPAPVQEVLDKVVERIFNKLMEDLSSKDLQFVEWERIPELKEQLRRTGEDREMYQMRAMQGVLGLVEGM